MNARLDHVAVKTANYEETVCFFETVFQMTRSRSAGEAPNRKLWFQQGIQINEIESITGKDAHYDHIAICVSDRLDVLQRAKAYGCTPIEGKDNWLATAEGLLVELM